MNDLVRRIVRNISAESPRTAHFVISSKASFVDPHSHFPGRTITVSPTLAVLVLRGETGCPERLDVPVPEAGFSVDRRDGVLGASKAATAPIIARAVRHPHPA